MNAWSAWMLLEGPGIVLCAGADAPDRREDGEEAAQRTASADAEGPVASADAGSPGRAAS